MSTLLPHAGQNCAARRSLEMQDAKYVKNSPSGHHRTTLLGCIFATKALIDTTTTSQLLYGPFSGITQVSQCQKRTSGLYGARED